LNVDSEVLRQQDIFFVSTIILKSRYSKKEKFLQNLYLLVLRKIVGILILIHFLVSL